MYSRYDKFGITGNTELAKPLVVVLVIPAQYQDYCTKKNDDDDLRHVWSKPAAAALDRLALEETVAPQIVWGTGKQSFEEAAGAGKTAG